MTNDERHDKNGDPVSDDDTSDAVSNDDPAEEPIIQVPEDQEIADDWRTAISDARLADDQDEEYVDPVADYPKTLEGQAQLIEDIIDGKIDVTELHSGTLNVVEKLLRKRDTRPLPPPPLPDGTPAPSFASPRDWVYLLGESSPVAESVEKLCTEGYNANLIAMSGAGKTVWLLHLAHCLAIGPSASRKLWGLEIPEPRATLYIAAEDQAALKLRSLAGVQYHGFDPDAIDRHVFFAYEHVRHSIMTDSGRDRLLDLVSEWRDHCEKTGVKPGLVVLDTQRQILGTGNTNESEVTSRMTVTMNMIQDRLDKQVTCYTAVHTKKSDHATYSGSGEQLDSREIAVLLERATVDGPGVVHLVKHKNHATTGESTLPIGVFGTDKGPWTGVLDPDFVSKLPPTSILEYPVLVPKGGPDHVTGALVEIQAERDAASGAKGLTDEEREERKAARALEKLTAAEEMLRTAEHPGLSRPAVLRTHYNVDTSLIAKTVSASQIKEAARDEDHRKVIREHPSRLFAAHNAKVLVHFNRWDEFCDMFDVDRNALLEIVNRDEDAEAKDGDAS